MKIAAMLVCTCFLLNAQLEEDDIAVPPSMAEVGYKACVFPLYLTKEGHFWVPFLYRNSRTGCIFTVTKQLSGKWKLLPTGIPLKPMPYTDSELSRNYGWIQIEGWTR